MEEKVVIVVPVFKDFRLVNAQEIISLRRLFTTLGSHQIYFIGPENLAFDGYLKEVRNKKVTPKIERFANEYFSEIEGYNRLMISPDFYKRFRQFTYALIYQLDAYVFRDELNYWCSKGYDYIGAPWHGNHSFENEPLLGVGNGGFSLRNVKRSIKLLKKLRMLEALEQYRNLNWKGIIPRLPSIIGSLYCAKKKPSRFERNFNFQEDVLWCKAAPARLNNFSCNSYLLKFIADIFIKNNFRKASVEEAWKFSFETSPRELFKMNNEQLPFGCHAWEKYDPEFWKEFIQGK